MNWTVTFSILDNQTRVVVFPYGGDSNAPISDVWSDAIEKLQETFEGDEFSIIKMVLE